jgi:hypothetical protein
MYLADTSAWHRSGAAPVRERWADIVLSGQVAMCPPVRLERLSSARGARDYADLLDALTGLPALPLDDRAVARADEVQGLLARRGQHRGPTPADLYIAAIAEVGDAVLVHYDLHFDVIARATGQASEWIVPRGSAD